jgi:uncharacterized membrane protein YhhN
MKSNLAFTLFYIFVAIIEIVSEISDNTAMVYVSKPLLILSLISYVVFVLRKNRHHSNFKLIIALLFALAGDVFLMIRGQDMFIPGLASFLIMQWLYIFTFGRQIQLKLSSAFALVRLVPFLLYAAMLFGVISPRLTDPLIKIAVGIYAISIALMAWTALLRLNSVSVNSFRFVFAGAILFLISDSLIAIGRFVVHFPLEALWIMGTYSAAQFMIVTGLLKTKQADLHRPV